MGRPGALDGVVEGQPQGSQGPGYTVDPITPCQGRVPQDRVVYLGQKPWTLAISRNILVTSVRTEAAWWWTRVPTRDTTACWHQVRTLVSPSVRSSCRLSCEASKAYRALSLATWVVTWSRCCAVSELSAINGATHCISPPQGRQDHILHHLGGREGFEATVVQRCQA